MLIVNEYGSFSSIVRYVSKFSILFVKGGQLYGHIRNDRRTNIFAPGGFSFQEKEKEN